MQPAKEEDEEPVPDLMAALKASLDAVRERDGGSGDDDEDDGKAEEQAQGARQAQGEGGREELPGRGASERRVQLLEQVPQLGEIDRSDRLRVGGRRDLVPRDDRAERRRARRRGVRMPASGGPPGLQPPPVGRGLPRRGGGALPVRRGCGRLGRADRGRAGEVVHIAGGRAHTIRNEAAEEARAYVVFVPGAEMEDFARAAAPLAAAGPPRAGDVLAHAREHGIEMTGPAPAAERTRGDAPAPEARR